MKENLKNNWIFKNLKIFFLNKIFQIIYIALLTLMTHPLRTPFLHSQNRPVLGSLTCPTHGIRTDACFEQSRREGLGYVPYDATRLLVFLFLLTIASLDIIAAEVVDSIALPSVRFSISIVLRRRRHMSATTWCVCHMLWSLFFCCVSMERSVTDFDQANPVRVFNLIFSSAPVLVIDRFQCCFFLDSKWVEWISEMLLAIKILFLFLLVSRIHN